MNHWLPYGLAMLLALLPTAVAQTPAAQPQPAAEQPATVRSLKVIALAGNQGLNDLEAKVMSPLVVQVLDQSDQPVEGAEVIFRFPLNGPSAVFSDQKTSRTTRTNADGQAAATGWTSNGQVGTFQVQVTASRGSEQGSIGITMTNVTRITDAQRKGGKKKWWSSRWGKVAIVAGAAVVVTVAVLATRGGSSTRVITATPGPPSIGVPQ